MESRARPVLLACFGALLALTALAGAAGLAGLRRLKQGESDLRSRYAERSARLNTVRTGVLLAGTIARDYFVNPGDPGAARLKAEWRKVDQRTRAALDGLPDLELRGEAMALGKVLELMAEMAGDRRRPGVEAYFQKQLAQRRTSMLRIADDVESALAADLKAGEAESQRLYQWLRGLLLISPLALAALGGGMAFAATRRLVRLEGETRSLAAQIVKAQEDERRSIARELHDEVGQWLSALRLHSIEENASPERMASLAARSIEALRRIALSLRPSMLDDLGLAAALEWQARETGRSSGLCVEVKADEADAALPEPQRTCIFRVAQEALTNCVRHAAASRAEVELSRADDRVRLRVSDDGRGFDTGRTRGLGLLGMAERVGQLGGRLTVRSEAGKGTHLTAELPL